MGLLKTLRKSKKIRHNNASNVVHGASIINDYEALQDILKLFSMYDSKKTFRSHIIKHLAGKKKIRDNDNISQDELDKLFGKYNLKYTKKLNKLIFYLIDQGALTVYKHKHQYKVLLSNRYLRFDEGVFVRQFKQFTYPKDIPLFLDKHAIDNKGESNKHDETNIKANETLFNKLVQYRKQQSKVQNIPPYMVFSNKTLEIISITMPTSLDGLITIKGIGKVKVEQYGKDIVAIINEHKQQSIDHDSGCHFISKKEMLNIFNKKLTTKANESTLTFNSYEEAEKYRFAHNEKYIEEALVNKKEYLDNILKDVDPNIVLDDKQRKVVLRDEDYTLVVAGAGAGKTTTVAAKVKYLVDKKNIDPSKILIVSYTNDAVNELITRINHELNIPAIISTFHKIGYSIVRKHKDMEKTRVISEGLMFNIIRDYVHDHLTNKPESLDTLVLFFGYYLDYQIGIQSIEKFAKQHARNDYKTLKTNLQEINQAIIKEKQLNKKSIKHEVLRSIEEVQIANFLYLNQIDYEYEAAYPYHIEGSTKLYTPDFTIHHNGKKIYLEHFGIHENGSHSRYSEEDLRDYQKAMHDKIKLHKDKGTHLIMTFSEYNDNRPLLEHLNEVIIEAGITPEQRSLEEVYYQLKADDNSKYLNKFIFLIKDFIQSFKINGYSEKDFQRLESKTSSVRNRMFLKLCKPIYLHYQQFLEKNDMVDFEDMINESAQILQDPQTKDYIPNFEYVIVDEYQDISQQRFDLTKELSNLTDAKIMAVGDDWQSIFAFAGSRVDLFVNFQEKMGYADRLNIDHTYRNAQEVIDIAGNFIQKNDMQLKKHLKSPKSIKKPIVLYEYSDLVYKNPIKGYKGIIHEKAKICDDIIGKILQVSNGNTQIAMLARYNFEYKHFAESEFFKEHYINGKYRLKSKKHPNANLVFMTVHGSKGLGFNNVIILNGSDEVFGFPAQLEMDPLLRLVKFDDRSYSYAEERRLFYVALTRTKNRVFILYPKTKPSNFVREIAEEYDLITLHGEINKEVPLQDRKEKLCPLCSYPLQLKENSAYGLKLYICTNEPELCSYMTNNLRSGAQSISKCEQCKDGFLIVKHSKKTGNYFFGCTNYKSSGKGCNNVHPIS